MFCCDEWLSNLSSTARSGECVDILGLFGLVLLMLAANNRIGVCFLGRHYRTRNLRLMRWPVHKTASNHSFCL
jgi:hypothetical protein